jgi:hypothetical protein
MEIDELILAVVEDLKPMQTAHLALMFYLCNRVIKLQKQHVRVHLLDLQAILYAELLKRGVNASSL